MRSLHERRNSGSREAMSLGVSMSLHRKKEDIEDIPTLEQQHYSQTTSNDSTIATPIHSVLLGEHLQCYLCFGSQLYDTRDVWMRVELQVAARKHVLYDSSGPDGTIPELKMGNCACALLSYDVRDEGPHIILATAYYKEGVDKKSGMDEIHTLRRVYRFVGMSGLSLKTRIEEANPAVIVNPEHPKSRDIVNIYGDQVIFKHNNVSASTLYSTGDSDGSLRVFAQVQNITTSCHLKLTSAAMLGLDDRYECKRKMKAGEEEEWIAPGKSIEVIFELDRKAFVASNTPLNGRLELRWTCRETSGFGRLQTGNLLKSSYDHGLHFSIMSNDFMKAGKVEKFVAVLHNRGQFSIKDIQLRFEFSGELREELTPSVIPHGFPIWIPSESTLLPGATTHFNLELCTTCGAGKLLTINDIFWLAYEEPETQRTVKCSKSLSFLT